MTRENIFKFDDELRKNSFLDRHYECLPYVGEKYETTRLLLIGESHYIPEGARQYVDRDDYYNVTFDELEEWDNKDWDYRDSIYTRKVFNYRVYNKEKFETFFANIATEIAKIIYHVDNPSIEQKREAMHHYAFMNYYKRPSYEAGKSIEGLTAEDTKYAYDISSYNIEVLNPRLIIFLSKKHIMPFANQIKIRG